MVLATGTTYFAPASRNRARPLMRIKMLGFEHWDEIFVAELAL